MKQKLHSYTFDERPPDRTGRDCYPAKNDRAGSNKNDTYYNAGTQTGK